jgi:hypothetical protein
MATPTLTYYRDSTGQWWSFNINPDGSAQSSAVVPQGPTLPIPTYSLYEDSTGQWWSFSINPDGSAETAEVSAPTPGPLPTGVVNHQSTITLFNTMEWAKRFIANRNTALGDYLEPAITSANIVVQTIIGAPFRWRWNRVQTGFITVPGQQDYYIFNWMANTAVGVGWVLVDYNGNCQTCISPGTTGATYPLWDPITDQLTVDGVGGGAVTWLNLGYIGAPCSTSYRFGWVEHASVQQTSPPKWWSIEPKIDLSLDSSTGRPQWVSAQADDGSGNMVFRLMPVPNASFPVTVTIQQSVDLFTSIFQTWAPIPDNYSSIYNWGFLAIMFLFSDDPRFQLANQKFVTQILGMNQGLDQSEINMFLNNWQEITGQPQANSIRLQQGNQARGV